MIQVSGVSTPERGIGRTNGSFGRVPEVHLAALAGAWESEMKAFTLVAAAFVGVSTVASAEPVSFAGSKATNYLQTADGVVTPYNDWSCVMSIGCPVVDAFSACEMLGSRIYNMIMVANSAPSGQGWYAYSDLHPTLEDLENEIPSGGAFQFIYHTGVHPGGSHNFWLHTTAFCPEIPELTGDTYSRLSTYKSDLSVDFTGSMNGFTDDPGANASSLNFVVYDAGKGGLFWSASMAPTETSFTIPGGSIEDGRAYFGVMYYTTSFSEPGAGVHGGSHTSSFTRSVFFYFNTRGPCPADLNGDGVVEDSDFVEFVQAYNLLYCSDALAVNKCPADLSNDGYVLDEDFVLFIQAYDQLLCEP